MSRSRPVFVDQLEGQSFVQVLRPSANNDHIIVGSRQSVRTVSINESVSGLSSIRSMKSSSSATTAVVFHPTADSTIVSAGSNGEVSVWYYGAHNVAPLKERWAAHSRAIHAMEFFPKPLQTSRQRSNVLPGHREVESAMLLTAGADGELNCWDLCSYAQGGPKESWRKPILVNNLRSQSVRSGLRDLDIVLHESQQKYSVVVATEDGAVEYYESLTLDPTTMSLRSRVNISTQTINSVRFDPASGGTRLASGGKDGYIRFFHINEDSKQLSPACAIRTQGPVWAVRWRPGGQYIAACQSVMDSNIYVWDVESRLMPAYVFSSHRDNVTDLFWIDRFHLLSCSRDNTVQMHAIKNAVIPIERMRTVNISISLHKGVQSITNVCDVINRAQFEKTHEDVDVELMRLGFPVSERALPFSARRDSVIETCEGPGLSRCTSYGHTRSVRIDQVPFENGYTIPPGSVRTVAGFITQFVRSVAQLTDLKEVAKCCKLLSSQLSPVCLSQAETMRLMGWLLEQPTTSTNQSVLPLFVSKSLDLYRQLNDVVMVLGIGAVALFSQNPAISCFMTSTAFITINRQFLDLLHRLGMWQSAAEHVFYSPLSEIRSISHMRTGINTSCANCKREQETASALCSKCKSRLSDCVLCGNQVKGLWTACEGCGHGGHWNHVDWWFKRFDVCPVADCFHQCRSGVV